MADNVKFQKTETATPPTGFICAADEIAGAKYQRMKLIHGGAGENAGDISTSNPLPVDDKYDDNIYYKIGQSILYMCQHVVHGTALSATDWKITKFTYDVDGFLTNKERLTGSVDGRAGLAWR
jgi:hypothetical protein